MSRSRSRLFLALMFLVALALAVTFVAGCGDSASDMAPTSTGVSSATSEASGGEAALEVAGPSGTQTFTLEEIEALPSTEGYGGMKSSTGRITPPTMVKGVLLEDLFAEVGGAPEAMAVGVVAKDGYEMTISVAQLQSGDFLTYDMATGAEKEVEGPLKVIIAYEIDGKPIDPDSDGPLRLAIVSPDMSQVTDGHWWVKWVTKIQVKPIQQEWTLLLSGALTEEMDRPTFETGAAKGCHGQDWTDLEGNTWTGIPLYLLVGRIDDEVAHEGPAYNRELAKAGYEVEIVLADGSSIKLQSETMYYKKDLIVAYLLNGEALPEEYWPLRLVGEGIDPTETVGRITEINALLSSQ